MALEPDPGVTAAAAIGLVDPFAGAIGAAVTAAVDAANSLNNLDTLLTQEEKSAAGGADVQADLETLASLYNSLSRLHESLSAQWTTLHNRISSVAVGDPGVAIPGIAAAWDAVTKAAGYGGASDSLLGNIKAVDQLILKHMDSVYANVQAYASNEGRAVDGFGKAAGAAGTSAPSPAPAKTTGHVAWA